MNFTEAYEELLAGKKITRQGWEEKNYLKIDEDGIINNYYLDVTPYCYDQTIIKSDGWILYKGDPDNTISWLAGLMVIKNGGAIQYPDWGESFISLDKSTSQIIYNSYVSRAFMPSFTCFMVNDWEIVP